MKDMFYDKYSDMKIVAYIVLIQFRVSLKYKIFQSFKEDGEIGRGNTIY